MEVDGRDIADIVNECEKVLNTSICSSYRHDNHTLTIWCEKEKIFHLLDQKRLLEIDPEIKLVFVNCVIKRCNFFKR